MKTIFMGSPAQVIPVIDSLEQLHHAGAIQFAGIISQPARPAGRKRVLTDPPVAAAAKIRGHRVWQPEKASSADFVGELASVKPDIMITAAYGQILSEAFLQTARRAVINIHPSILPLYRGATPVQSALLDGQRRTGVTILFTVKKLDAGNIILTQETDIAPCETADQLLARLFQLGAQNIGEAINKLRDPSFLGTTQDETRVTHCTKFTKEDGLVDWNLPAEKILHRYQAFTSWPGLFTTLAGNRIAIESMQQPAGSQGSPAGTFSFNKADNVLLVATGDGICRIDRLKPAGKASMDAASFINGFAKNIIPQVFGEANFGA